MAGRKPQSALRRGWTTGACAAAAAKAAYHALLTGTFPDPVTIRLPQGRRPEFALARKEIADAAATAGVVKDAGDDPDVTHGALVCATVRVGPVGSGVHFAAGEGVGTVTKPGLALPPGEPAINPGPRKMIAAAIADVVDQLAEDCGATGDVAVTVAIPGGAALAEKTMNARLGIVGGLSVLGTTGVVVPYSCASWIASIHRGIDVARAAGLQHLAGATGRTSETAVRDLHGLPEQALIDMGDFAGGMLKYLRRHPVPRLTIAGGFGKLAKLAAGHLDLHSSRSQVDLGFLADLATAQGATKEIAARIASAGSAGAAQQIAVAHDVDLAGAVARRARGVALATLAGGVAVDVAVFDRGGTLIGHAGD
jgi:cobalt-precorrin-5B (C1)-methyltransferase